MFDDGDDDHDKDKDYDEDKNDDDDDDDGEGLVGFAREMARVFFERKDRAGWPIDINSNNNKRQSAPRLRRKL